MVSQRSFNGALMESKMAHLERNTVNLEPALGGWGGGMLTFPGCSH